MSVQDLGDSKYKYHAFLTYSSNDRDEALKIYDTLASFKICFASKDFMPGEPVLDNIKTCIGISRRVLHLFSKSYLASKWCNAELNLTEEIQQSQATLKSVFLLLGDTTTDDIPELMKGKFMDVIRCDEDHFLDKLCSILTGKNVLMTSNSANICIIATVLFPY